MIQIMEGYVLGSAPSFPNSICQLSSVGEHNAFMRPALILQLLLFLLVSQSAFADCKDGVCTPDNNLNIAGAATCSGPNCSQGAAGSQAMGGGNCSGGSCSAAGGGGCSGSSCSGGSQGAGSQGSGAAGANSLLGALGNNPGSGRAIDMMRLVAVNGSPGRGSAAADENPADSVSQGGAASGGQNPSSPSSSSPGFDCSSGTCVPRE